MKKKTTRNLRIYPKYFRMIKSGVKTVEIRVGYDSIKKFRKGDFICFNGDPDCTKEITRISWYTSVAEMLNSEDVSKINPYESKGQQLATIQKIYPPKKQRLGVVAFELA